MNNGKPWYTSKTIWINLIALIGSIAIALGFSPDRWAEISATILAVVNIILRFVTEEPITIKGQNQDTEIEAS